MRTVWVLGGAVVLGWATPARAEPHGILIRLDAGGETLAAPVVAVLKPQTGDATEVTLADDGRPPDVAAGDGSWSGAVSVEGDAFDVSLKIGDRAVAGGPVSWAPADQMRDLDVHLKGGALTMTAGVAKPVEGSPSGPGTSISGPAPGGVGSPPVSTTGGALSGPGEGSRPTVTRGDDGALLVQLGVGLLALLGAAWAYTRVGKRRRGPRPPPPGVTRLPRIGLAGEGTPSISDGLSAWVAAEPASLVEPLLATLADRHRVLVVAPADAPVPSANGGPVYRIAASGPAEAASAARAMLKPASRPLAVLVLEAGDAARWVDLRNRLPDGVGAVIVCAEAPAEVPTVLAVPSGEGWLLRVGEADVRARLGRRGFAAVAAGG